MGRRNWCKVNWDEGTGDLVFDIRVEKEKGHGQTVGYASVVSIASVCLIFMNSYVVRVPPPRWSRGS
jgi:hypothetical protein